MVLDAAPLPGLPAPGGADRRSTRRRPRRPRSWRCTGLIRTTAIKASASQGGGRAGAAGRALSGHGPRLPVRRARGQGVMMPTSCSASSPWCWSLGLTARCTVFSGRPDPADALADQAPPAPGPGFATTGRAAVPLVAAGRAPSRPPGPPVDEAPPPCHLPHDAVRGPARPRPVRPPGVRPGRGPDDHPVAAPGPGRPACWPTG